MGTTVKRRLGRCYVCRVSLDAPGVEHVGIKVSDESKEPTEKLCEDCLAEHHHRFFMCSECFHVIDQKHTLRMWDNCEQLCRYCWGERQKDYAHSAEMAFRFGPHSYEA